MNVQELLVGVLTCMCTIYVIIYLGDRFMRHD